MYYSLSCWLMGNLTLCCSLKRCSSLIFSASSFPFFISIWASLSFRTSVRSRAPWKVQMTSGKKILWNNKWWIRGRAPPAFRTKLRPEGPKKMFVEDRAALISGSGWLPPPSPPPQQFWRSGSITDNAVHVCDTDEFYLYSHSSFVGFNLLHETSWLYLFGSTEGSWLVQWLLFFSVLGAWLPQCQSLLFLPVDKKDGFINDVKHLLKYLCLHRGPLEMYGISSKL